jgi:hypothetical protein
VRLAHRRADLCEHVLERLEGEALGRDGLIQRLPLEQLHDEKEDAVRGVTAVVDLHDVRVADVAQQARLAEEALHELLVPLQPRPQRLHRHLPVERLLHTFVHRPEPALADLAGQPVGVLEDHPDQIALDLVVHQRRAIGRARGRLVTLEAADRARTHGSLIYRRPGAGLERATRTAPRSLRRPWAPG